MSDAVLRAILGVVGLISLASLGAILLFIPPTVDGLVPILFSVSLFLALVSILTFVGMRLRRKFVTSENREHILAIAFRESILISLLLIGYLWLAHLNAISVWAIIVPLAAFMTIEYFLLIRYARRT